MRNLCFQLVLALVLLLLLLLRVHRLLHLILLLRHLLRGKCTVGLGPHRLHWHPLIWGCRERRLSLCLLLNACCQSGSCGLLIWHACLLRRSATWPAPASGFGQPRALSYRRVRHRGGCQLDLDIAGRGGLALGTAALIVLHMSSTMRSVTPSLSCQRREADVRVGKA